MSINLTTDNPPNPREAHAGNQAGESFFQNLAETLNAGFSHNNLHIYSQGFKEDAFKIESGTSTDDMVRVYLPPLSTAHTAIKITLKCLLENAGSGTVSASLRNSQGSSLASDSESVANSYGNYISKTLDLTGISLTKSNTLLQLRVGGSASGGGRIKISDIHASWLPLTSSTLSAGQHPVGGPFIPLGTGITSNDEPMSSALGRLLMLNAKHLSHRPVNFASVSGIRFTGSGAAQDSVQYIEPFVRAHIVRVCDTQDKITIKYAVRAHNSGSSPHDFKIMLLNPHSLFDFTRGEANHMDHRPNRGEYKLITVAANADSVYTGSIEVARPFDSLGFDLAGCSFIAIGVCTRAMLPRDVFGLGSHDDSLKIRSYSFWSE